MKTITRMILLSGMIASLLSCAGMKMAGEDDALAVAEALNAGNSEELISRSGLPFAFDGEILASESQLRLLWEGLVTAGYVLDNPVVSVEKAVSQSDALRFSDSWEMDTYFHNILSEEDRLFEIKAAGSSMTLILRKSSDGYKIMACKGDA